MSDPTPMDRLRELELTPDLPRPQLWKVIAAAVQEVQDRFDALDAARNRRPQLRRTRP